MGLYQWVHQGKALHCPIRSTSKWLICVCKWLVEKIPVIAGTGSNSTREAIELTTHAKYVLLDAALIVVPYYNKPNQAGLYEHYKAIAEEVDMPIIIYNIPGRSVVKI